MTKQVNLYGRKTTLTASHFTTQGYCKVTAAHGLAEIEKETYTPERTIAWMRNHILIDKCDQCTWANRIKMSIVDFLREEFPERYLEWCQGLLNDPKIAGAWVERLKEHDPPLLLWFLLHPQNFTGYDFIYAELGSGKAILIKKLKEVTE